MIFEARDDSELNLRCFLGDGFGIYFEVSRGDNLDWMWGLGKRAVKNDPRMVSTVGYHLLK